MKYPKKVLSRDAKEDVDRRGTKNWSGNSGGKPTRGSAGGFSLQDKTFSAFELLTQDSGTILRERLKNLSTNSKWATLTKSQILSCLSMSLQSVQTVTKENEVVMREIKRYFYRASSGIYGIMWCYFLSHQLNCKNNGPVYIC